LAAAGLGLFSYQNVVPDSTCHAESARVWLDEFKTRYCTLDEAKNIINITTYYDPEIDQHVHAAGIFIGFGVAWYVLPQDVELAFEIYNAVKSVLGWPHQTPTANGLHGPGALSILGLLLAQEFGDEDVVLFLRGGILRAAEEKSCGPQESGYFFHRNEQYPRGQLSALLSCSSVLSKGQWFAFFNRTPGEHAAQHGRPKVVGVEYPYLGLSDARYTNDGTTLLIKTYSGTEHHDLVTSFSIVQLPDSSKLKVSCDGVLYQDWKILNGTSIEIKTKTIEHVFTVDYGATGGRL
jgi:hypothetical protein